MTIEDFLTSHSLISLSGIEKELVITHGTLRKGKKIPETYKSKIEELLCSYGFTNCEKQNADIITKCEDTSQNVIKEVINITKREKLSQNVKEYYVRNGNRLMYDDGFMRSASFPDDTVLLVEVIKISDKPIMIEVPEPKVITDKPQVKKLNREEKLKVFEALKQSGSFSIENIKQPE